MKRTFIYKDDKSNKFWTIEAEETEFTVTYGKVGTAGQTSNKSFADEAACQKEAEKLIAEKTKKGYMEEEVNQAPQTGFNNLKEALAHSEQALSLEIYCDKEALTPEIAKLVNLQELKLYLFPPKMELPIELASLPNLKSLRISGSSNIILPDFIKAMPLEKFSSNIVSYGAVAAIKTLKKLEILIQEKFTVRLDHICQNLPNLTSLTIRGYVFDNEIPASIKELKALEELIIDPKLTRLSAAFSELKNLGSLEISVPKFPEEILQLPKLETLIIRMPVDIPESIKNLPLRTLHIKVNEQNYTASLAAINQLTGLTDLSVKKLCSLDDIGTLTHLQRLSIYSSEISDWSRLGSFTELEHLDVSYCKNIKPEDVAEFGKLKHLKSIIICSSALDSMEICDLKPIFTLPAIENLQSDLKSKMEQFEKRKSLDYKRPEPKKEDTSYLKEWQWVVDSPDRIGDLVTHFIYLADTPGKEHELMGLLYQIMVKCVDLSIRDNQLVMTFEDGQVVCATAPASTVNAKYPETFKKCLQVHESIKIEEYMFNLTNIDVMDIGYESDEFEEVGIKDLNKVVGCIWDYSDCWFYHPKKKNAFGEPVLCFLSHEGGDPVEHEVNVGAAFIYRWAENLDIETNFDRYK